MPSGNVPEAKGSGEKSTISQADTNGRASHCFHFYSLLVKMPRELAAAGGNGRAVWPNTVTRCMLRNILQEETEIGS